MVLSECGGITQYIVECNLIVFIVTIIGRKIGRIWLESHLRIGGKIPPDTCIRICSRPVLVLAHLVVETRFK